MATTASVAEFKGVLLKKGGQSLFSGRSWKERFCVIEAGCLSYYQCEQDYVEGRAPLKQRHIVLRNYNLNKMVHSPSEFRLVPVPSRTEPAYILDRRSNPPPKRQFVFKALKVSLKDHWLRALGAHTM
jgi:hypothetical protein